ncbi:hypothetical protein T09_8435 [Trichinella sp. T9]|nr:hypothetical protein T09_8435 [Trichinella sp. T9]
MNGASLNRCLEPGPKLQPDLVAVSLRFRRSRIGIRADIEKMYLQAFLPRFRICLSGTCNEQHRRIARAVKGPSCRCLIRVNSNRKGKQIHQQYYIATDTSY